MIKWEDIVKDPNFPEDEKEQNKLKLRFWENIISKDPKFPTDIKEQKELKNRFFGVSPVKSKEPLMMKTKALSSLQDIAKIMPKEEPEFKWEKQEKRMGAEYIPAKVVSGLVERPFAAMGEPISWVLEKGFRALGLTKMADTQKEVTELYKKPPLTQKVQQQTAYLRQQAYSESAFKGTAFDVTEGVTQLMNLLTQIGIAKKLPGLQGQDIYNHFKVLAGYKIATTPGSLPERLQSAMFIMAYSMTPFIANWTGATGLTAVATDTALNIFLTSPVYQKAWKESKNAQEFFQMAIPQLVMDIGMAWNTRGLPANQAKAMYNRYLKAENRVIKMEANEFQKLAQDLKTKTETKEKLKPKIIPEPSIKTKEELYAEKYGIPLEKVKITELPKEEITKESEAISKLIEKGKGLEEIPEPTKEDLAKIEAEPTGKEKFMAKMEEIRKAKLGLEEGFGYEKSPEGHKLKVMRAGDEFSDKSRGGTWYDIEIWKGQKSSYTGKELEWGVGGKKVWRKEITLSNPYLFKIPEVKAEGEVPIKLWEEVTGEKLENKRGFYGAKAEAKYAKLEKEISEVLKSKGYDGIILYNKIGIHNTPKQIFDMRRMEEVRKAKLGEEPRIGEKETLLESETGAMYMPSAKDFKDVDTKLKGTWDVQAPFVKIGANETGFQLKNYFSQTSWGLEKGITAIKDIVKLGTKNKLAPDDFTEVTFATESPVYLAKLSPETRTKLQPIIKKVNAFYKEWEGRLKDIGWMEEPFPQSLITRNNKDIESYRSQLKLDLSKGEKTKIKTKITELQVQNRRIKDLDLKFVSVPIRMILGTGDTAIGRHFMSILPKWGRKTITIKDLVDEGVLTREQADIRSIIGEYTDRMSRKYALGKIFKAAEADGLIAKESEKPEWTRFTAKIVPQLKGKVLNPAFNDMLTSYFGTVGRGMELRGRWQNFIGLTKMMQFYNPLFLPMYDVMQGAMAGTFTSKGTPKNIVKAFRDSTTRSKDYWEAFENGLFSKPFTLPFEKYEAKLNNIVKPNTLKKLGFKAVNVYQLSWNTAWKLDEIVRLMTYNHLKDKGMNSRDAAQTAAMFHADYASVPPATRKVINQILFTPTFKICMGKLYWNMAKGVARTAFHPRTAEAKEKTYAKGMIMGFAMLEATEFLFNNLGYETEEKYRKYVKRVQTNEGLKESVITLSNPMNVPWRYYYRAKKAIEPSELNKLEKLASQVKWELTPVYRVGIDLITNNYENAYENLLDADHQIAQAAKFVTGELVKIIKPILETEKSEEFRTESFKVLQKELGTLNAVFLEPFIFHYVRDVKEIRKKRTLYTFMSESRQAIKYTKDPKKKLEKLRNYYKILQQLYKQF